LGVMIRNESANKTYTTDFMCSLFEEEGGQLFDVRQAILGHIQQGGNPTPFDRIMATRLGNQCIEYIDRQLVSDEPVSAAIGQQEGRFVFTDLDRIHQMMDRRYRRPREQWWLALRPVARVMAQPGPVTEAEDLKEKP